MNTPISPTADTVFIAAALQSGKQGIKNTVKTGINWTKNQITKIRNGVTKSGTTVIGRVKDLQNLKKGEQSLLNRLPDRGSVKANWKQNSGVIRQEISKGKPIRDASPGDTSGQFLNAERNLLRDKGWAFDSKSNYWTPPN